MSKFSDKETVSIKVRSVKVDRGASSGWVVYYRPHGFLASWELYKICHNEKDARVEADLLVERGVVEYEVYKTRYVEL